MATITFDTLAYAKKLKAAGVPEAQAEIQAETQRETIEIVVSELETRHLKELATKSDIRDMATMTALAEAKADIIKWVVGLIFMQTGVIVALMLRLAK